MKKIVINVDYGGFNLSATAVFRYAKLKGFEIYPYVQKRDNKGSLITDKNIKLTRPSTINSAFCIYWIMEDLGDEVNDDILNKAKWFHERDLKRDDLILIQVVEELGKMASGDHSSLEIVEIPDDVNWEIEEYDGNEWVSEIHRTWR
jgi:hypothetical protein